VQYTVIQLRRSSHLHGAAMDSLMFEPAKKKRKSGASGWAKYNQKRKETGIRLDPYIGKGTGSLPSHVTALVPSTSCLGSTASVSMSEATARMSTAVQTEACPERLPLQDNELSFPVQAPKTVCRATQTEPVEDCLHVPAKQTRDTGVGEHLSGELFLWRGIFDLP